MLLLAHPFSLSLFPFIPLLIFLFADVCPTPSSVTRDASREATSNSLNLKVDDDDEFGDPFDWMYDQPNGQQRVKVRY